MDDLDCQLCSTLLREERGCGVWPVATGPDGQRRQCRTDLVWAPTRADHAVAVRDEYHLADMGGVASSEGLPWPWCPRWFLRADGPSREAREVVRRVGSIRRQVRAGVPAVGLTAAGAAALATLNDLVDRLECERIERRRDEIEAEARAR